MRVVVVGIVAWPLLLSACWFDSALPEGALIICEDNEDCPARQVCNPQSHFCARQVGSDGTAPVLDSVRITPAAGRPGTTFTIDIAASEALLSAPAPRLSTGVSVVTLAPRSGAAGDSSFSYRYRSTGDELEGPAPIVATLVDVSGNATLNLRVGELVFDETPPGVLDGSARVALFPAADNPLAVVTAATVGTAVHVTLTTTEELSGEEPPTLTSDQGALAAFSLIEQTGNTLTFGGVIQSGVVDGPLVLTLHATDLAGNAGDTVVDLPAPGVVIDVTAPDAPVDALLEYGRAPWGAKTGATPFWYLIGEAGAVGADVALVRATDASLEIGRAVPSADGSVNLSIAGGDRPRVRAHAIDGAGNRSSSTLVHRITFYAAMNGKRAGDTFSNPHTLEARGALGDVQVRPLAPELLATDDVGTGDDLFATVPLTLALHRVQPNVTLAVFADSVWDPRTHRPLFWEPNSQRGFAWNGDAFVDVPPSAAPSPRSGTALAFDSARSVVLLYGGSVGPSFDDDDLWEWDTRAWRRVLPVDGVTPGRRIDHRLAFDSARGVLVLFGGAGDVPGQAGATWEWDGARWTQIATVDPEGDGDPFARSEHVLGYHPALGVVLVGGHGLFDDRCELTNTIPCRDSWIYDGASWRRVTGGPPQRRLAGMALDEARGVLVVHGGIDAGADLADTWELGAAGTWVRGPDGPARSEHNLVWDGSQVFLWGGLGPDCTDKCLEGWRYDGAWTRATARSDNEQPTSDVEGIAEDPAGSLVLVELRGNNLNTFVRQDGGWFPAPVASPAPARFDFSFAYDATHDVTVLFGGKTDADVLRNDLWQWDGATWSAITTGGTPPSPRQRAAMVDATPLDGVMVLSGDDGAGVLGDAFLWNGTTWSPVSPNPGQCMGAAVARDPAHGAVLFGGYDDNVGGPRADTWLFGLDGVWRQVTVTDIDGDGEPAPRFLAGAAYAPALGGVMMFRGFDGDGAIIDDGAWVFVATGPSTGSWRHVPFGDLDGDGALSFDEGFQSTALDPASGDVIVVSESSQFRLEAPSRPAAVLHVDTRAALAAAGATTTSILVRSYAAGACATAGSSGAELLVWNGSTWLTIPGSQIAEAPPTIGLAENYVETVLPAGAAVRGEGIHVAVTTRCPPGDMRATLAVDAIDVLWSYLEP